MAALTGSRRDSTKAEDSPELAPDHFVDRWVVSAWVRNGLPRAHGLQFFIADGAAVAEHEAPRGMGFGGGIGEIDEPVLRDVAR